MSGAIEPHQDDDLYSADQHFEACAEELIRRTRDSLKFPLVFKSLTEYGFRRNLLGLKPIGLFLTLIGLVCNNWLIYRTWINTEKTDHLSIVAMLITIGILFSWLAWVSKSAVNLSANRYARFILESSLDME